MILTHKNVSIHALGTIGELQLTDRDVWLHAAPLFHLADAWASWAITWVGGTHVLVSEFDPPAVLSAIERRKVTLTNLIPTMLNMLINDPEVKTYDFSSLNESPASRGIFPARKGKTQCMRKHRPGGQVGALCNNAPSAKG